MAEEKQTSQQATSQQASTPQSAPAPSGTPKKSNLALIIILIVVFGVIILGVGGYFAWKYFKSKTTVSADKTNTKTSTVSLKDIETTFKYPNATITKTDRTKGGSTVSQINSETIDSLNTVYDYYLNLAATKKLTVSRKTLETDGSTGMVTIQGSGYYVDLYLYKYEKTEIDLYVYGENIKDDTASAATTPTSTTPSTASTNSSKTTISTDYVIADSNTRVISEAELTNLTPWQLKVARNEIYARYGREFVHKDLQCYFGGKSWYTIDPNFSETELSATDTKNVATIQAYEQKINSPLQNTDSGC